jgi:hypothetical protein
MSIKAIAAKIFARSVYKSTMKWATNPVESQQKVFMDLIHQARKTQFGIDHNFE